ncbi:MAG: DUF1559 domain-containing protein [Pirellulales bacterium]|nr:DUF1559 domain-containing protein [Pirellulales bacterium]
MSKKLLPARRGFTVLELLIVVAIIGLLIALLLPAIQAARAAARRNVSRNNLRNWAIAMHNYSDAHKSLPPLFYSGNKDGQYINFHVDPVVATRQYSWLMGLFPYIEQDKFYRVVSQQSEKFTLPADQVKIDWEGQKGISPGMHSIPEMLNPAEPPPIPGQLARTNYIALPATKQQLLTVGKEARATLGEGTIIFETPKPNGSAIPRGVTMATVSDGTSRTVMLSESSERERSSWYDFQQTFACGFLPEDTSVEGNNPKTGIPRFELDSDPEWVFNTEAGDRSALNYGPTPQEPNRFYNSVEKDPLRRSWGPSSSHPNSVVSHACVDSSIKDIVVELIEPKVYYSMVTRRGAEPFTYEY